MIALRHRSMNVGDRDFHKIDTPLFFCNRSFLPKHTSLNFGNRSFLEKHRSFYVSHGKVFVERETVYLKQGSVDRKRGVFDEKIRPLNVFCRAVYQAEGMILLKTGKVSVEDRRLDEEVSRWMAKCFIPAHRSANVWWAARKTADPTSLASVNPFHQIPQAILPDDALV